jgi:hypothetical protein
MGTMIGCRTVGKSMMASRNGGEFLTFVSQEES